MKYSSDQAASAFDIQFHFVRQGWAVYRPSLSTSTPDPEIPSNTSSTNCTHNFFFYLKKKNSIFLAVVGAVACGRRCLSPWIIHRVFFFLSYFFFPRPDGEPNAAQSKWFLCFFFHFWPPVHASASADGLRLLPFGWLVNEHRHIGPPPSSWFPRVSFFFYLFIFFQHVFFYYRGIFFFLCTASCIALPSFTEFLDGHLFFGPHPPLTPQSIHAIFCSFIEFSQSLSSMLDPIVRFIEETVSSATFLVAHSFNFSGPSCFRQDVQFHWFSNDPSKLIRIDSNICSSIYTNVS